MSHCSTEGPRGPEIGSGADVVADVPAGALGRDRGRRFLHDGGLDVTWPRDVLHRVRDRPRVTPRPNRGLDAVSRRAVHAAGRAHADGGHGTASSLELHDEAHPAVLGIVEGPERR